MVAAISSKALAGRDVLANHNGGRASREIPDILAAMFVQKSCVDIPGFMERTDEAGRAFIEAVAKADPMIVVWIAAAVAHVKPVS